MKTVKRAARLLAPFAALLLVTAGTFPAAAQTSEEAVAASERGDHATSLRGLRIHAEQGDADAQYDLGLRYQYGIGVRQDTVLVECWK